MSKSFLGYRCLGLVFVMLLVMPPAWSQDPDHEAAAVSGETQLREAAAHDEPGHEDDHDEADHDEVGHGDGEEGHGHGDGHGEEEHGEEGVLRMDAARRQAMGVLTAIAKRRPLREEITAPGEVILNAYRTAQVTPRISAQIMARHARLGERVEKGQPLVTLSSVAMAEAQGGLLEAHVEWRRVKKLGRKVVSERRYIAAQVARQQAHARVRAYGMTEAQIRALLKHGDASRATGEFELLAPQAGTVIRDDFVVGEFIEPGRVLFEISDETVLWVEAQLAPALAARIADDAPARVRPDGGTAWVPGRVVQRHHRLDETTRTLSVRVEVENRDDLFHPGQFVEVALQTAETAPLLAVPRAAVILMEGSPTVFKVEGDELHPQPVETGQIRGDWTEIRSGLAPGEEIVVQGVFVLKALLLKSKMGEGHAH